MAVTSLSRSPVLKGLDSAWNALSSCLRMYKLKLYRKSRNCLKYLQVVEDCCWTSKLSVRVKDCCLMEQKFPLHVPLMVSNRFWLLLKQTFIITLYDTSTPRYKRQLRCPHYKGPLFQYMKNNKKWVIISIMNVSMQRNKNYYCYFR